MPPLQIQGRRRKEHSRHRGGPAIERDDIQQIHPSIRPQPSSCAFCVLLVLVLAVRLSDREKNDNSIPSKETVPRIFWKRVSNMRQSSCGHRTETVSAAAGESRMSCRPGSGRMCGTLMRTQRFLYSMIQKITTRQSVLHLGKKEDREEKRCFWRIP